MYQTRKRFVRRRRSRGTICVEARELILKPDATIWAGADSTPADNDLVPIVPKEIL
jgi:hypothetical protein